MWTDVNKYGRTYRGLDSDFICVIVFFDRLSQWYSKWGMR
jgi:hypothetical protein